MSSSHIAFKESKFWCYYIILILNLILTIHTRPDCFLPLFFLKSLNNQELLVLTKFCDNLLHFHMNKNTSGSKEIKQPQYLQLETEADAAATMRKSSDIFFCSWQGCISFCGCYQRAGRTRLQDTTAHTLQTEPKQPFTCIDVSAGGEEQQDLKPERLPGGWHDPHPSVPSAGRSLTPSPCSRCLLHYPSSPPSSHLLRCSSDAAMISPCSLWACCLPSIIHQAELSSTAGPAASQAGHKHSPCLKHNLNI